jgi:hypothetical protein
VCRQCWWCQWGTGTVKRHLYPFASNCSPKGDQVPNTHSSESLQKTEAGGGRWWEDKSWLLLLSWDRIGVLVFLVQKESEKNCCFRSFTFLSSCWDGGSSSSSSWPLLNWINTQFHENGTQFCSLDKYLHPNQGWNGGLDFETLMPSFMKPNPVFPYTMARFKLGESEPAPTNAPCTRYLLWTQLWMNLNWVNIWFHLGNPVL